ncbi:MAG: hypothetical protein EON90_15225, partial [Brevundimonas sp.]
MASDGRLAPPHTFTEAVYTKASSFLQGQPLTAGEEMGGFKFYFFILIAIITCEMANMGYGRMLGALIAQTFDDWVSLTVLACFAGYSIMIYMLRYLVIGLGLIRAAKRYHQKMLDKVVNAKVLFFDTNSVGQVLNRFANDIGVMDKFIPIGITDILVVFAFLITIIITVGIVNPILLAPLLGALLAAIVLIVLIYPSIEKSKIKK